MNLSIYDPSPPRHDYLTAMYFAPMRDFAAKNGITINDLNALSDAKDSIVLTLADNLNTETISVLKNNGCKIVGFSITDSSYVSESCRKASDLGSIDLMFMLTGLQTVNYGRELVLDTDLKLRMETRVFLPDDDWKVFDFMRRSGRLQSLPYVHWEKQPEVEARPLSARSQKVLIRGGHHMRRFILALTFLKADFLDVNSGFITEPYFQDSMRPEFRYCDHCRARWKKHGKFTSSDTMPCDCWMPPTDNLGSWNNWSPKRFCQFARLIGFKGPNEDLERLFNARWLPQEEHLFMLSRITFTSDLKWLFSIYAAQRFWDAAMVGCINLLPLRTNDQEFFPEMNPMEHYVTYHEDNPDSLQIGGLRYGSIAKNARELYDKWLKPTDYKISTNLLGHIFEKIEEHL